jgi:excisionase family DNA binding protein
MASTALSREELLQLPAVVKLPVAARALGLGRNKAYELVHAGKFPCTVLHLGNAYRVPTAELLRLLGITTQNETPTA